MKTTKVVYVMRCKVRHYDNKQLVRLYRRMWKHIEKWYGAGSWDWPTLYVTYPQLARMMQAIRSELNARDFKQ